MRARSAAKLSASLNQRLSSYSLAALACEAGGLDKNLLAIGAAVAAAGISILASAPRAEAKIVYTPAHVQVTNFLPLDLNHDMVIDFGLKVNGTAHSSVSGSIWFAYGSQPGNLVVLRDGRDGYVAALRAGVRVGGASAPLKFGGVGTMAQRVSICSTNNKCTTTFKGPWANGGKGVKNRYLGLKFQIKGKTHYGWARLDIGPGVDGRLSGLLTGYAYETIANKAIVTGQKKSTDDSNIEQSNPAALTVPTPKPATLGALAMGAPGLSIWRRKEASLDGQQ
jgi:hypothetical protein